MFKSTHFFIFAVLVFAGLLFTANAQDISVNPNLVYEQQGQVPLNNNTDAITITHSATQTITTGNSVSCNAGGLHTDNSYFRAFDLPSFGITNDFNITEVSIGIETAAGTGGTQPITVNLWTSSQPFPTGFPGSVTQIGTASLNVPDQTLTVFPIAVTGTAPAGSELVVEIFTPDGQTAGHSFFIGSNADGETGPSYLLAADCGVTTPTPTGSIGFPNMHIVMNVTGDEAGGPTARVQVIHNSADLLANEVDVYIDGALALDNFAFRTATPYIDLPAGVVVNIGVAPGNSGSANDTLKNFPVTLTANETYVVFANGVLDPSQYAANPDGRNTAFTLFVKDMARETGLGSDVDFFVLHGSTDAPTVDVKAREAGNVTLIDDAAYSDITPYIQVPPADYTLDLYLSDGVTLVESFIAPLSGLGGGAAAVFASGFLDPSGNQNGAAFGIFAALPDGTVIEFVPGVVPVELSAFTVSVGGNAVTLNWSTVTETNNQGFEIQRKSDNEFVAIGFINGNGTTTEIQNYSYTDRNLNVGSYSYRLKQVDFDGSFEYSDIVEVVVAPADFSLNQNYPNPFNPSTIITFNLAVDSKVILSVFNTLGEEVTKLVNGNLTAGTQQVEFDATEINSGVYFYKLEAQGINGESYFEVRKMMLTK
ncbi:MAG: DUF4397 domain-containing protein [Ignavibacteria bacterium]|nr:DUF4397 domain-containing protein [Ignavibacteria bacterium]MBT8391735.1 DUF4397 domain-containing protein [Ignavibacteria bacterium]